MWLTRCAWLVNAVHFLLVRSQEVLVAHLLVANVAHDTIDHFGREVGLVQVETVLVLD